jgi:hypothetical protein
MFTNPLRLMVTSQYHEFGAARFANMAALAVRARLGRLSALSVFRSKCTLYQFYDVFL